MMLSNIRSAASMKSIDARRGVFGAIPDVSAPPALPTPNLNNVGKGPKDFTADWTDIVQRSIEQYQPYVMEQLEFYMSVAAKDDDEDEEDGDEDEEDADEGTKTAKEASSE